MQTLDCRDLKCPLPIVRISQRVKDLSAGELLSVQATDAAFRADVEAWAEMTGHELVEFRDGPVQQAIVRVR